MPRLLAINNYYYRRGGSETVFFGHNRLFEDAGWEVVPFAMRHVLNAATPWEEHFVGETEEADSRTDKLARAANAIYSFPAAKRIRNLLRVVHPDIAHAHNIYHHLSPSVLVELRSRNIPVVLTLHDLKLACPAYKMYSGDTVCEDCRGGALRNVVKKRCIKGSASMSALVWLESTIHRLLNIYAKSVSQFVVPSRFFISKFSEWGVDTSRFKYVPNSIDVDALVPSGKAGDEFVYVGRLVPEKGVDTLIRAAAQVKARLRIIGTGPDESMLKKLAVELGACVDFSGYLTGDALSASIGAARAVVIPSRWYENAPLSAMETSALARPVIGADIGGIPELIRDGETGFIFRSGDVDSLAQTLSQVRSMPDATLDAMGQAGRDWMRVEFSPRAYFDRMSTIYEALGAGRGEKEKIVA